MASVTGVHVVHGLRRSRMSSRSKASAPLWSLLLAVGLVLALPPVVHAGARAGAARTLALYSFAAGQTPENLAIDRDGTIYVTLAYASTVSRLSPLGSRTALALPTHGGCWSAAGALACGPSPTTCARGCAPLILVLRSLKAFLQCSTRAAALPRGDGTLLRGKHARRAEPHNAGRAMCALPQGDTIEVQDRGGRDPHQAPEERDAGEGGPQRRPTTRVAGEMIGMIYMLLRTDVELLATVPAGIVPPDPMLYDYALHKAHAEGSYVPAKKRPTPARIVRLPKRTEE